jgi:hypothetical protein
MTVVEQFGGPLGHAARLRGGVICPLWRENFVDACFRIIALRLQEHCTYVLFSVSNEEQTR